MNNNEVEALLKAGSKLTPKESKRKEKEPWTIDYFAQICQSLNCNNPKDTAILGTRMHLSRVYMVITL